MISTACPLCGRVFNVGDDKAGKSGKCPCGGTIVIPSTKAASKPQQSPEQKIAVELPTQHSTASTEADYVPCPFCAEPVRSSATKCRHCGELLGVLGVNKSLGAKSGDLQPTRKLKTFAVAGTFCCVIIAGLVYSFIFKRGAITTPSQANAGGRQSTTASPVMTTVATGGITGEAWIKLDDNSTQPVSATEILLVPVTLKSESSDIQKFLSEVEEDRKSAADTASKLGDNQLGQEAKTNAEAVVKNAKMYFSKPDVPISILITASKDRFDAKAAKVRDQTAAFGRSVSDMFARQLLDSVRDDPLWHDLQQNKIAAKSTDREGKFHIDGIAPGAYAIVCRAVLPDLHAIVQWSEEPIIVKANETTDVSLDPNNDLVTSY